MSRLVTKVGRRHGRWWDVPRPEPTPTGEGYRSSKRAYAVGMRAGGMAIQQAKRLRTGDCDEIKRKALEYAQTYLDSDPELFELRQTEMERRPPKFQAKPRLRSVPGQDRLVPSYDTTEALEKDTMWQDTLSDLSEMGAYKVIDLEWLRMGCKPGKQLILLPEGFGRLVRRHRRWVRQRGKGRTG